MRAGWGAALTQHLDYHRPSALLLRDAGDLSHVSPLSLCLSNVVLHPRDRPTRCGAGGRMAASGLSMSFFLLHIFLVYPPLPRNRNIHNITWKPLNSNVFGTTVAIHPALPKWLFYTSAALPFYQHCKASAGYHRVSVPSLSVLATEQRGV